MEQELKEVQALIEKLTAILNSKKLQFDIIKTEMLEIKKKFKDPRKSQVISSVEKFKVADSEALAQKSVQSVVVSLSANGYIKAMTPSTVSGSSKVWTDKSRLAEAHINLVKTTTNKNLLVFTNLGNVFKVDVNGLPISKWKERGIEFSKLVRGEKSDERPVAIIEENVEAGETFLLFYTKDGMIKKTLLSEYSLSKALYQAIKLKDGDELLSVEVDKSDTTILFITQSGIGLNAEKTDIPDQGRISGGVKGIALVEGDCVVSANQVSAGQNVVIVTNKAYAKQINTSEIDVLARYRKGVKVIDLKGDNSNGSQVVCSGVFGEDDDVVIQTDFDEFSAIAISSIQEDTRLSKGRSLSVEDNKTVVYATVRNNS